MRFIHLIFELLIETRKGNTMADTEKGIIAGKRICFLDNLRTFLIFLVVLIHAGGVYESSGAWASFWIVDDASTNNLAGILFLIIDIFVMPTIFLISGYFAPLSMVNKEGGAFLKSKFKRLMIPWVVAVLTLIPLYKIIFLYSRNLPQESWTTYFHWSNGIWSQNWLWFLPVLFLFNILYLLFSKVNIRFPRISLKGAVFGAFLTGFVYSVSMDVFGLRGWTKIWLLDFQNERLLIYFMAFLLGALCFKLKVFDAKPESKLLYHILNSIAWIPVTAYIFFLLYPWFKSGSFIVSEIVHKLILWLSFHLSLLCLVYVMIETFRRYQDKQGKLRSELNRNSYYVYIIHVIVTGGIALIMLNTTIPSLVKFLLLTVSTFGVSNMIIYFYRQCIKSTILINRMEESTMKTVTKAMLIVTLLAVAGCSKQENPAPKIGLFTAAVTGNLEAVHQHIKAGSDLDIKEPTRGSTPLITATVFGKTKVAMALIEGGADVNCQNNEGSTPLITAAVFCRTEIVKALLDKGANKTLRNKAGRNALESVSRPFDDVIGIYNGLGTALAPLGLKLDYERIKMTRPKIAEILR
jgi:fucose 4-O-acetylase-like acetyltransferase